jgi:hypothetical protein
MTWFCSILVNPPNHRCIRESVNFNPGLCSHVFDEVFSSAEANFPLDNSCPQAYNDRNLLRKELNDVKKFYLSFVEFYNTNANLCTTSRAEIAKGLCGYPTSAMACANGCPSVPNGCINTVFIIILSVVCVVLAIFLAVGVLYCIRRRAKRSSGVISEMKIKKGFGKSNESCDSSEYHRTHGSLDPSQQKGYQGNAMDSPVSRMFKGQTTDMIFNPQRSSFYDMDDQETIAPEDSASQIGVNARARHLTAPATSGLAPEAHQGTPLPSVPELSVAICSPRNSTSALSVDVTKQALSALPPEGAVRIPHTTRLGHQAYHTYLPKLPDELAIVPGDILLVDVVYSDGWAQGIKVVPSTGERLESTGVFPVAALEISPNPSVSTSYLSSPQDHP